MWQQIFVAGWAAAAAVRRVPVDDFELTRRLGTKTPYYSQAEPFEIDAPMGCAPVQVNMVVRHGTRYPTHKVIAKIAAMAAKLQASNATLPTWLKNWDTHEHYPLEFEAQLAPSGVDELVGLGDRMRQKYGLAFVPHYEDNAYVFEHTWKVRTQQSAAAFAHGFFNSHEPVPMAVASKGDDVELRFFDNCPLFTAAVENNATAWREYAAFPTSPSMRANVAELQATLQLPGITAEDLDAVYEACAFDVSVHHTVDRWCSLMGTDLLSSMEYYKDLKAYYKKSYGNPLAYEIAAPLLRSLIEGMIARRDGGTYQGIFRFAHAETILPLSSLLGFMRGDRPLEAVAVQPQRAFKSAIISPFGANIAFVLYACDDGNHVAQLLLNEKQLPVPGLGCIFCPLELLEKHFAPWITRDFDHMCSVASS
ncbi:multiple inositol polyphosphate phosphatase 1 [Achlya hypogyna]|uniref:Multiple inositol polyphosphate phosphatase 1 n=1 Tax=Achlya hypogyna TaxID=1202772 RepID=A0A1V9ZGX2_ACHHY|nr:multiple inositol polyphosphate phosphatase 1 [Achlya hypogyna]